MTTETAPNRRLTKWFIGIAIFTFTMLLHVTFPNMGGSGLRLPFNAAIWMGFGLMMALSMWPATRGVIRYSAFHKGLGLLLLALWLPFLWTWNEASLIALPRMLTVTAGAILLLGLAQLQLTRRDWWWLGMAILLGALMETALGYVQLYLLEPGNWLGYNPEYGRPYGIFQQVNVMASFLVTGLVVSAWLFGEARNSKLELGVILLAPLFMPALIVVITSRTGWLAALIAVPLVLIHLWRLDRSRLRSWAVALATGCLLAVMVSMTQGEGGRSAESISSAGPRVPLYEHSLRMISQKPVTGWGYGRFQHDFLHSHVEWRTSKEGRKALVEHYGHPHNEILYWGIEGGLIPLLSIVCFSCWVIYRTAKNNNPTQRLLLISLLSPLTFHSMTEYPFYASSGHWLTFIILLGFLSYSIFMEHKKVHKFTFGAKALVYIASPVLVIFMLTHLQALWKIKSFLLSEGKDTYALAEIKNPLGAPNDLEFLIMSQQISAGTSLGIEGTKRHYSEWAKEKSKTLPGPEIYINLLNAYKNQEPEHQAAIREIKKLFPGLPRIREIIKNEKIE